MTQHLETGNLFGFFERSVNFVLKPLAGTLHQTMSTKEQKGQTTDRRKELNRLAAQKLRNRQKEKSINIRQDYFNAQSNNTRLTYEVKQLRKQKNELQNRLNGHFQSFHPSSENMFSVRNEVSSEEEAESDESMEEVNEVNEDSSVSMSSTDVERIYNPTLHLKCNVSSDFKTEEQDEMKDESENDSNYFQLSQVLPSSTDNPIFFIYLSNQESGVNIVSDMHLKSEPPCPRPEPCTRSEPSSSPEPCFRPEPCLPLMVTNINDFSD